MPNKKIETTALSPLKIRINLEECVLPVGCDTEVCYTSKDKEQLSQIKQNLSKDKQGLKRGRKIKKFAEYCEKTKKRIRELK
jgi:hypothetical protein